MLSVHEALDYELAPSFVYDVRKCPANEQEPLVEFLKRPIPQFPNAARNGVKAQRWFVDVELKVLRPLLIEVFNLNPKP